MELLAITMILTLSIGLGAFSARFMLETVFSLMMRSPARRTARAMARFNDATFVLHARAD
jgi:hypothetical protein